MRTIDSASLKSSKELVLVITAVAHFESASKVSLFKVMLILFGDCLIVFFLILKNVKRPC